MLQLVKSAQRPTIEDTKPRILIVDDELPVLLVLKRALRKHYDITVALNARHALELLENNAPFAVIVSDMRMPGGDGVAFLSRARELSPDTSRIMLTGDMERDTALNAVNDGGVLRFLQKPCASEDIAHAIAEGVEQHDRRKRVDDHASNMLADFQDELRAPLMHILDYARLIRDGVISQATARDYARQIVETGSALLETSTTILDLTAMKDGRLEPELKPSEIGVLARAALRPEARLAAAKGIDIRLETGAHPFSAILDHRLISRAVSALISNAVKVTGLDGAVTVSAKPIGEGESHVCFEIRDEGCGFPDHLLTRVRQPFELDLDSGERNGLGLALAWSTARLHQGYLEIENLTEGGACVRLILPAYPRLQSEMDDA